MVNLFNHILNISFGLHGPQDPTVATDFLPDQDRARHEEQLRIQLKKVPWAHGRMDWHEIFHAGWFSGK